MANEVTLNGVELNKSLLWLERAYSEGVGQEVRRTLGGKVVLFAQALSKGVNITLEARERQGWLTKAQADAVKALAATPGASYVLDVNGETHNVVFRHHEPPAVELEQLIPDLNPGADDYYVGQIKLMTV
jgi:hypothetical protein